MYLLGTRCVEYTASTFAVRQYIYWEHYVSQIRLAAPTRPALTPINLVVQNHRAFSSFDDVDADVDVDVEETICSHTKINEINFQNPIILMLTVWTMILILIASVSQQLSC